MRATFSEVRAIELVALGGIHWQDIRSPSCCWSSPDTVRALQHLVTTDCVVPGVLGAGGRAEASAFSQSLGSIVTELGGRVSDPLLCAWQGGMAGDAPCAAQVLYGVAGVWIQLGLALVGGIAF